MKKNERVTGETEFEDGTRVVYVRKDGFFRRNRRKFRQWRRAWIEDTVPADDDGPEDLPAWLQGVKGRVILGLGAVALLAGWMWAFVSIVQR